MSDHIKFYLFPNLPKSASKTGRIIWLKEKVRINLNNIISFSIKLGNGYIICLYGFENTNVFKKFFEFVIEKYQNFRYSNIIQLKVESLIQLAINPEIPLDAVSKVQMFRKIRNFIGDTFHNF